MANRFSSPLRVARSLSFNVAPTRPRRKRSPARGSIVPPRATAAKTHRSDKTASPTRRRPCVVVRVRPQPASACPTPAAAATARPGRPARRRPEPARPLPRSCRRGTTSGECRMGPEAMHSSRPAPGPASRPQVTAPPLEDTKRRVCSSSPFRRPSRWDLPVKSRRRVARARRCAGPGIARAARRSRSRPC